MALPTHILLTYGYSLLFVWILVEQLGVPLPATPALLAAGALAAEHRINLPLALLIGTIAALLADSAWFLLGRKFGHRVLRTLNKLSLQPADCIRRTQNTFGRRRGATTLMISKFVPALATLAPPIAGVNGMDFAPFLFFDGIGATIWVGALLLAGRFFGDLLNHFTGLLNLLGRSFAALLVLGVVIFLLRRVYRRRKFLKSLAAVRMEPQELKRKLDSGEKIYIADLRHPLEMFADPFTLPGAHTISPETLTARSGEIPRDRDVVLYCTCPSEATAAKTAMQLCELGIVRVRPLRGGFDEWKRLGYPLDAIPPVIIPAAEAMASSYAAK